MITGHKSTDKDNLNKAESATVNPIQHKRMGADSLAWISAYEVTSGVLASGSTTSTISITGIESSARAGDFLYIGNRVLSVISVSASSLLIGQFLASVPTAGTAYSLRRYLPPLLNSNGETIVTPASGSLTNVNITQYGSVATSLGQKASASSIPAVLSTEQEAILSAINNKIVSSTSAPDTTDPGIVTRSMMFASTGGVGGMVSPEVAYDTPSLFSGGLIGRNILYTTDGFSNYPVSSDTSGRFNINSRTQDSAGNGIASATGTPTSAQRGLIARNLNYNWDSGAAAHFRNEGDSLYGTTYVTERSTTGVFKSFGSGASGTGTQRVVLANDQPTVRDSSGNAVESGTASLLYNARGLATRDASGVNLSAQQAGNYALPLFAYLASSRVTTTGSTTTVINTTVDPSTVAGDGYYAAIAGGSFSTGWLEFAPVLSVNSSSITLQHPLRVAPGSGQTVYIYKPRTAVCNSLGYQYVSADITSTVGTYPVYFNKFFAQSGTLDYTGLSSSYATVLTTVSQIAVVSATNLTNTNVAISLDRGTTDCIFLPPNGKEFLPMIQNGGYIDGFVDIQAKDLGVAATSGLVAVTCYYF